jgi:signal transduction histidine kinase
MDVLETAIACVAFLAMAGLSVVRARRDPMASRFAALCIVLLSYNAFQLIKDFSGAPFWDRLNNAAAAMCTPVFFHFTMAFLGQRRLRRPAIIAFYAYFSALAVAMLVPGLLPMKTWALSFLAGMLPAVAFGATLMITYARRQLPEERLRTALLLGAILVAAGGNATDLFRLAGAGHLALGTISLVVSAVLLALVALRSRLLDRVSWLTALIAFALAFAIVLGEIALFLWAGDRTALLAIGSVLIALSALLAGRFLLSSFTEARLRTKEQAARGRMSKQLGHDIRNPLGAIKGAAQFLEGELDSAPLTKDTAKQWIDTIVKNADRITKLVARYEHLARMVPELRETQINEIVDGAIDFLKTDRSIDLVCSLDSSLPGCMADPDLVMVAVANVARNAREALVAADGASKCGTIRVSTRNAGALVAIEIADDGPGMTAATRENIFDDFYTTKPTGSGLGLPFVQRVMQVHSGTVRIDSIEGKGTTVTLELPVATS